MTPPVLPLEEVRARDAPAAGGKAASLGELRARSFPVPPGFVVPAAACRASFERLELGPDIAALEGASGDDLARRCAGLRRRITEADLPVPLAEAVLHAHERLLAGRHGVPCAVRSSATAEDLPGASFAGQHGTYYYVGRDRVLTMLRHCWASLWSPEVVRYRSTHGIPHAGVFMAVLVQEMVLSEVAGVAFTADPVTGARSALVIEACWGMGAAIVDGRVTPDRYLVSRDGLAVRERRIADKRLMVPPRVEDGAERLRPVPPEMRHAETLRPEDVREVAEWALRCEERFGAPQDVEWAFAGGRFHLLQSRPITTLSREGTAPEVRGRYVLFKAAAENFTEPVTPLTEDLLSSVALPGRFIGGRLYLNLAYLRPFVPLSLSDQELAELAYLGTAPAAPPRLSLPRLPVALLAALAAWLPLAVLFARTRGLPDDCMEGYRALCRRVEEDASIDALGALRRLFVFPRLLDPVGRMPVLVNISSLRFIPWLFLLGRLLRKWMGGPRPDLVSRLTHGGEGVLSAEMGRSIAALARAAAGEPRVRGILAAHVPAEALPRLRGEGAARGFLARLEAFLAVHGHRGLRELELRSPRWAEDPAPVLAMIRNHLAAASDGAAREERAAEGRLEAEAEVGRALAALPLERRLGLRRRLVRLAARRAAYFLKLRENSRFYHILGFGTVRRKILAAEAELRAEGRLKCQDDVFFLRWAEVAALREGRLGWPDVEGRIRERRLEHVRLARLTPPRTIGIPPARAREEPGGAGVLQGQPASPGRHVGRARVILDPSVDCALEPGDVLVAPYTDPAWTPLFLTAGAAVVEVGSYLSHAGTVAREFGLPCVVDAADCTRRIQDGARVEVDGDRGRVRVLQEAP